MKKKIINILFIILFLLSLLINPKKINAQGKPIEGCIRSNVGTTSYSIECFSDTAGPMFCESWTKCINYVENNFNTESACKTLPHEQWVWVFEENKCKRIEQETITGWATTSDCEKKGTNYEFSTKANQEECSRRGFQTVFVGNALVIGTPQCRCLNLLSETEAENYKPLSILRHPLFCGDDRNGDGTPDDILTALGCIPTDPQAFVALFLNWGIGIAGGIAFLFMLFGAFQIMTSTGNPEKLKAGQEILTSAIIGLLFIIFSVFLLRIIGQPIMFISGGN